MLKRLRTLHILTMALCCLLLPASVVAAVAPVAVFPLQDLGGGRNEVNLPFTEMLGERLNESGNQIIGLDTVITFMANGRIRTVGSLESMTIKQAQRELGAAYVLLGSITQQKEHPHPSLALTLNLVSTSNARPVWTYVGALSIGDHRKMLGVGEPTSTADLQKLLLEEIVQQWPWERLAEIQQGAINLETVVLEPTDVRPGDEVHCRVRLSDLWVGNGNQQFFFKVGDQLYPAVVSKDDDHVLEATWVAGEENGRVAVDLLLRWPQYQRTETALLGSYHIDGMPPLLEIGFKGTKLYEGEEVFFQNLVILPRLLVRKPLDRWRLAFYYEGEDRIGVMEGEGDLPENFVWAGKGNRGDGMYKVQVEAWDRAGNRGETSREVKMIRNFPQVDFLVEENDKGMVVDLAYEGKVPIKYWRLEVWNQEGRILTQREGSDFPAKIDIDGDLSQGLGGILFYEDALGKTVRRDVRKLLPKLEEEKVEDEEQGLSESWVDEF